ncbi:MAG: hypothetical protein D6786_07830 [Gammaproteobacteria bacterium]|nr:MAG: hypothetical protein D6786_07830 [Gammaproteobacteria bacterium]
MKQLHDTARRHAANRAGIQSLGVAAFPGFIRHPRPFPLKVRRRWWSRRGSDHSGSGLGIYFWHRRRLAPGTLVTLAIPLRGETQEFEGEVVAVRQQAGGYEIGLWLNTVEDACRARIVEQICHIECYLKERQLREGQTGEREQRAREWVEQFAAHFPA